MAGAFLRLQCVHKPQEKRKAGVYAPESIGTWIGETSEGLAVEQLAVLRNERDGACGYRCRPGMKKRKEKPKTHPHNPRVGHPTFDVLGKPGLVGIDIVPG